MELSYLSHSALTPFGTTSNNLHTTCPLELALVACRHKFALGGEEWYVCTFGPLHFFNMVPALNEVSSHISRRCTNLFTSWSEYDRCLSHLESDRLTIPNAISCHGIRGITFLSIKHNWYCSTRLHMCSCQYAKQG